MLLLQLVPRPGNAHEDRASAQLAPFARAGPSHLQCVRSSCSVGEAWPRVGTRRKETKRCAIVTPRCYPSTDRQLPAARMWLLLLHSLCRLLPCDGATNQVHKLVTANNGKHDKPCERARPSRCYRAQGVVPFLRRVPMQHTSQVHLQHRDTQEVEVRKHSVAALDNECNGNVGHTPAICGSIEPAGAPIWVVGLVPAVSANPTLREVASVCANSTPRDGHLPP